VKVTIKQSLDRFNNTHRFNKNTKGCICLCVLTKATYALCYNLYNQCSQNCFCFSHCFKCVLKTLSSVNVLISDGKVIHKCTLLFDYSFNVQFILFFLLSSLSL